VRLFIAINLPDDERRAIRDATAGVRGAAPDVSWTAERHLHLTLKFLGTVPDEGVAPLRDALHAVASSHRAPRRELGDVGAFPNLRAPRIVWLGLAQDVRLELLQHDIESACEVLGYEVEGRLFRPHITLGRVRRPLSRDAARALADAARPVTYTGTVEPATVDLMQSQLTPAGPKYTVMAALPFGGR
jgi:2'-5' RNA ligase